MKNMLIATVKFHKRFWIIYAKVKKTDGTLFYLNVEGFRVIGFGFLF